MIEIDVSDIVEATASRLVCGDPARTCRGCAIDSRKGDRDAIFGAFPGERVDGNAFAAPALEAGAGCVVMTADAPEGVRAAAEERGAAIVRTDDPTAFMLDLASWWRDRLDARLAETCALAFARARSLDDAAGRRRSGVPCARAAGARAEALRAVGFGATRFGLACLGAAPAFAATV